jgi:hypothetical protein
MNERLRSLIHLIMKRHYLSLVGDHKKRGIITCKLSIKQAGKRAVIGKRMKQTIYSNCRFEPVARASRCLELYVKQEAYIPIPQQQRAVTARDGNSGTGI